MDGSKLSNAINSDIDKAKSKKSQIVNFFAGGIAGTVSSTLTTPLDVIKTQLQSSRLSANSNAASVVKSILKEEGIKGMFKGILPMLIGIIPTRAIYFWSYTTSKDYLRPYFGDNSINHLISAFSAGITSNTITNPIWMIKTRYQIIADKSLGQEIYSNYWQVIQSIYKESGIKGFYKGLSASYIGCFEGGIQWLCYEKCKSILQSNFNKADDSDVTLRRLSNTEYFLTAAFSKFIAIVLTYPHEVVRTRLREQALNTVFKYNGFLSTLVIIGKEEGVRGLYGGMNIHLARAVPNAAIMFLTFEVVSHWLQKQANVT